MSRVWLGCTLFSTYSLNNLFHLISIPIWKFSNLQEILVHKKRRGGIEKAVAALLPLLYFAGMAEPGGRGKGLADQLTLSQLDKLGAPNKTPTKLRPDLN